MDRIYQQQWIALPKETREHLKKVFGIQATGVAEIIDQTVVSDGVTNANLQVITAERMAEYVGSTESFLRLWELTIAKVKYELHPPIELETLQGNTEVINVVTKFCDTCDSKGVRHLKVCPKFK